MLQTRLRILGGGLGRSALGLADTMSGWCYLSVRMFCYCAETEIESCQCRVWYLIDGCRYGVSLLSEDCRDEV